MKIVFFMIPFSLCAITKSELQEKGWENCKEGFKDIAIGTVKVALAAKTLMNGDIYSSLYIQAEAGVSFSEALTAFKESYCNYRDARQWREDREIDRHD